MHHPVSDPGIKECSILNLSGKCSDFCDQPLVNLEDVADYRILDLSLNPGIGLQHIDRFVAASELNLHGCRLTTFTDAIANLKNLTVLIFSYNDLSTVPQTIDKLSQLRTLDLSGNRRLKSLPPGIAQLQSLQVLNLSYCSFSELPGEISTLVALEKLDVSDNPLASRLTSNLPVRLRTLHAHSCALEGCWPPYFESLDTLHELSVSDNELILELHPIIGVASALRKLVVSFCDLTQLPHEIGQLLSLEELDCRNNLRLTTLPTSLTALCKLRVLCMARCSIKQLPDDLGYLSALENLDISGNIAICTLPTTIGNLQNLLRLSAACCSLRLLPPEMERLTNLQHLDLSNNCLSKYPDCTLGLDKLNVLLLSNEKDCLRNGMVGNSIQVLPEKIVHTSLSHLDLHRNPMIQPPSVVCQHGIFAIISYMKAFEDGATKTFPDSTINVLGCSGGRRKDWVATLFGSDAHANIVVNGMLMTINDLTPLYCYPELIPQFLTEGGTIVIAVELTDDVLCSNSGEECISLYEDRIRRLLLTMLCRLSQVRAVVVAVASTGFNACQLKEVEHQLTQFVKNLVLDVANEMGTFEANLESPGDSSKVCMVRTFQEASVVLSGASVEVLVLRDNENVASQFMDYINRKLCEKPKNIQPTIPEWWCRVMEDLVNNLGEAGDMFSHMNWCKVLEIFNDHLPDGEESCNESALCAILSLLSSTAQIVWMREHPILGTYVLGRPRILLDTVLSVLEHSKCLDVAACTKHYEQYRRGLISDEFLQHLLQASDFATVLCDFMKVVGVFGEIYSTAADVGPHWVLLSSLSEVMPLGAQMSCGKINPTVSIHMSFVSGITPNGFFETCLSSSLSIMSSLEVKPQLWRHGMFFTQDGIDVTLSRLRDGVSVSACVGDAVCDIWGTLYPLLQCLASSIASHWKGIRPICSLVCPVCACYGIQELLPAGTCRCCRLLPDLGRVQLHPASSPEWTCSVHNIQIPSYLCSPRPPGCLSVDDRNAILMFVQHIGNLCDQRGPSAGIQPSLQEATSLEVAETPADSSEVTHRSSNKDITQDEHRAMAPEIQSVQTRNIICTHASEAAVLMFCLHKCCETCARLASAPVGNLGPLYCPVCQVDTYVWRGASIGCTASEILSSCPVDRKLCEEFCTDCNQPMSSECLFSCMLAGNSNAKGTRAVSNVTDRNEVLHRMIDSFTKQWSTQRNYVNEVRLARTEALEILFEKKMRLIESVEAEYSERESELKKSYDRLEELAAVVQSSAQQLQHTALHALNYATNFVTTMETNTDLGLENEREAILSRLMHLEHQLLSARPATTTADLVGDCALPYDIHLIIKKWMATPRAWSPSAPKSQLSLRDSSASIPLCSICCDVALTKDGRLLLAAGQGGLIELSSNGSELSRWVPPPAPDSGWDDRVRAVVALDDGRAAISFAYSPIIMLLRRSIEDHKWTVDRLIEGLQLPPWHLSVQDDLLAAADDVGLKLMSISCGQLLNEIEELQIVDEEQLRSWLPKLPHLLRLKQLGISRCNLTEIMGVIGNLSTLEELDLSGNDLSGGFHAAFGRLGRLRKLSLRNCHFTILPDWIGDLQQLEELHLSGNDLSSGVNAALGRLGRLRKLTLRYCALTSLPDSIANLQQLTDLTLDDNKLSEYPPCTLHLKNLQRFSVENNCITSLPVELAYTNLKYLHLNGNPIMEPPEEIWNQGIQALKSYLRAVIPGGEIIYADTLNMIGDTGAGKTSVAQSLIAQSPKPTEETDRTRVLEQRRMAIDSGHSVIINDFGGHEIYHSVMPIFLPTNGLLILVYNMMDKNHEETVKKWMFTAIAKSEKLRLIIVGTHAELLADRQQRLVLEKQMVEFSSKVLKGAINEVDYHVNHLNFQPGDTNVGAKLTSLRKLRENLTHSAVHVVTLSCSVPDGGLSILRDVVIKLLPPPVTLPIRWCRVINDIKSAKCLYITMKEVEDICRVHFTDSDDNNALTTILSYLAKSSQIIWLENHPVLGEKIFHSPQKIIDTCKKILHHNTFEHDVALLYKEKLEQYEKGVLPEPLLWELLSASTKSVNGAASDDVSDYLLFNVVVNFLEHFSLISYVRKVVDCKEFIVPCKLTSSEPKRLQDLEQMEKKCLNRVTVCLSFIGSVIPMSLFETSLSSMLTVAGELSKHLDWPEVWKDGAIVLHNGVFFYTKRKDAVIILTAFSQPQDPSPWTILHPILKHLNDNVIALWHGAPPSCAIPCPWCARQDRRSGATSQAAEIKLNLKTLVAGDDQSNDRPMCRTCMKTIPRCLCSPTTEYGSSSNDQCEIDKFFGKLGVQIPILSSTTSTWSPSALDGMELQQLEQNFRRNCNLIITKLTSPVVKDIVRLLYSKDLLMFSEKEEVESKTNTATEAAATLIDYVLKKNDKRLYCTFIEILHATNHGDLITALTS